MIPTLLAALLACARPGALPAAPAVARARAVVAAEPTACDNPVADAVADAGAAPPCPLPAVNEPLPPGDGPTLMLSQAWFYKQDGKYIPGPARLRLFRQTPEGWVSGRLEDADSNVFHQSFALDHGIVTLGAERALLRLWTPTPEGWSARTLFEGAWCGKFDRLRELERGNVDADADEEWVIATHDQGVVVVLDGMPDHPRAVELDREADTFVHEIELGDLDGDGRDELYVADDDQGELERLTLDPSSGAWRDEVIGALGKDAFTWNIARGP